MSPRPFYESSLTCIERIQNIAQALLINLRFGHDGSIIPILQLNEAVIDQLTIAKKICSHLRKSNATSFGQKLDLKTMLQS